MSGLLGPVDFASLALLLALGLLVLSFRRRAPGHEAAAGETGDWLAKTKVEREASESGQPALSVVLLEPAAGDGDPPDALPGDLALLRGEAARPSPPDPPRRGSSTDPAAVSVLMLIDPQAAIAEEAIEGAIDPAVSRWARLLLIALVLVAVLLRFRFG